MLQKLVSNSAPIYPIVLILVLSDRRKIGVHHAPCLIFCIWGGGAPLLRITKKNSLNTYTGPRKKLISPVLFNLGNLFWYQSTQKTKPDTLDYIRISPTEGGSPPRQKNRKKFFKRNSFFFCWKNIKNALCSIKDSNVVSSGSGERSPASVSHATVVYFKPFKNP